jgi:hypothetical protein
MTFQEYVNQADPQKQVRVLVKPSDCYYIGENNVTLEINSKRYTYQVGKYGRLYFRNALDELKSSCFVLQ